MTRPASTRHFNWSFPPTDFTLSEDEVHVWVAELEQTEAQCREHLRTLSANERERAARFRFRDDRKRFITARAFLRRILSRYCECAPEELHFFYGENGKPFLQSTSAGRSIDFNLAHSSGLALYAVTQGREIGIDIEKIADCPDIDGVAARCFLPEERSALHFLEPRQKAENFFRYWTRKEAQLKCSGEGLSRDNLAEIRFDGTLLELEPAEGYIAALAVRGQPFQLKSWQWRNTTVGSQIAAV